MYSQLIVFQSTDAQVLNFALTLEYLEATFYTEYLHSHSQSAFEHAGLPPWVRGRFEQIKAHEDTHVEFLKAALGDGAVQPCEYNLFVHFLSSRLFHHDLISV